MQKLRQERPEALYRAEPPAQDQAFPHIGIEGLPDDRPLAYIRLYPQDFLVEEVTLDGHRVHMTDAPVFYETDDRRTLWVNFIKAHMSQYDALKELATGLNVPLESISYAGIKDTVAITSQRLAIRGATKEQVAAFHHNRIIVHPFCYGNGSLQAGNLRGNTFTLVLRTKEPVETHVLERRLNRPFWNFFGPQRFGTRTISHKLGQLILQGDVNGCLKLFFTAQGQNDVPFYREVRQRLADAYGDWDAMDKICADLPMALMHERTILAALKQDDRKTRAALGAVKDQARLWVYAYGSWLMNRELSRLMAKGDDHVETIPTPFSPRGPHAVYAATMKAEGTDKYAEIFPQYPFLVMGDKTIPTQINPQGVRVDVVPQGALVRFTLDKGAYATTCLSHAFQVVEGLPVPSWVQDGVVDGLARLHETPLQSILTKFEPEAQQRRDAFMEDDAAPGGGGE